LQPSATKRKFIYNLSRSDYHKQWGKAYRQPGPGARVIAFLIRVLPKVGPLRSLAFKAPTPETEKLFMQSVNETLDSYRKLLAAQRDNRLQLPNENFDTGKAVAPGKYRLADAAYVKLLDKLSGKPVPADLRADIWRFMPTSTRRSPPSTTKKRGKDAHRDRAVARCYGRWGAVRPAIGSSCLGTAPCETG
jgi:hypothetical protein